MLEAVSVVMFGYKSATVTFFFVEKCVIMDGNAKYLFCC